MLMRTIGYGLAWLILALIIAGVLILVPGNILRFQRIFANEEKVVGTVTGKYCDNHDTLHYSFQVEGKEYVGTGNYLVCKRAKVGQPIIVFYDKNWPDTNIDWDPLSALWNEIIVISLACLTMPPLIIWRFVIWMRVQRDRGRL